MGVAIETNDELIPIVKNAISVLKYLFLLVGKVVGTGSHMETMEHKLERTGTGCCMTGL